ncbi:MAG: hypothetical protein ACYTGQ_19000 [Planctomycetota bacterium]|jgi:hypothetical protein
MSYNAQLLRMLEPSVRPTGAPARRATPSKPIEAQSFEELMDTVSRRSAPATLTRPLHVSPAVHEELSRRGVELSDDHMLALREAADRAEAKGATSTLMLMGKTGLVVHVPSRTVNGIVASDPEQGGPILGGALDGGVVTGIDSAVHVQTTGDQNEHNADQPPTDTAT